MRVDPLADSYVAWSPYNYVMGNPISFIDPDGRFVAKSESKDDIIFNVIKEDGSKVEIGRLITDDFDKEFNFDIEQVAGLNLEEFEAISINGQDLDLSKGQAISFDISGEAAFKLGIQGQLSLFGMVAGPDNEASAVAFQVNGLVGLEAGVTVGMSFYYSLSGEDLALDDLSGYEYGIQGDVKGIGVSLFRGKNNLLGKDKYWGHSFAGSLDVLPSVGSGSVYAGYSSFIAKFPPRIYRCRECGRPLR